MKIDRVRSCCSKTAEENAIKLYSSSNRRTIFTSSEYHELLELDLKMLLYFFSRKFNIWSFFPTLCNYAIFSQIVWSDVARAQLCKIAPVHNIRSPDFNSEINLSFIVPSYFVTRLWLICLTRRFYYYSSLNSFQLQVDIQVLGWTP